MRQASFFGNAIQETRWLDSLVESGGSERWYGPWHGRGFLQLTNPDNYCSYWAWRGRRIDPALRKALVDAYHQAAKKRRNEALRDEKFPGLTETIKDWRDNVRARPNPPEGDALFAPADSAGFYWLKSHMAHYADQPHVLEAHAVQTNDGQKTYYRSPAFWKASAAVNLPSAVKHTNYSGLNGFDSRCCAYGIALAVLSEVLLPDDKGNPTLMFPNDFLPRR